MAVGVVVQQADAQPQDTLQPQIGTQPLLDVAARKAGIAVGVEQALARRHAQARAVDIDRAALEDPVARFAEKPGIVAQQARQIIVERRRIFPAPAIAAIIERDERVSAIDNQRPGVAQPDVEKGGNQYLRAIASPVARRGGGFLVCAHQPNRLAPPSGMDRAGKGSDFAARALQIVGPQIGRARIADPDAIMRRPFGRHPHRHCPTLLLSRAPAAQRIGMVAISDTAALLHDRVPDGNAPSARQASSPQHRHDKWAAPAGSRPVSGAIFR